MLLNVQKIKGVSLEFFSELGELIFGCSIIQFSKLIEQTYMSSKDFIHLL